MMRPPAPGRADYGLPLPSGVREIGKRQRVAGAQQPQKPSGSYAGRVRADPIRDIMLTFAPVVSSRGLCKPALIGDGQSRSGDRLLGFAAT